MDIESLSVEVLFDKNCNTIFNVLYRSPNGQIEPFENHLMDIFNKTKESFNTHHIAGDFNLNILDHNKCKKVQDFHNLIYQNKKSCQNISK